MSVNAEGLLKAMVAYRHAQQAFDDTINELFPVGSTIAWLKGRGERVKRGVVLYEGSHRGIKIRNIDTGKEYFISPYDILCATPELRERYFTQ